MSASVKIKVQGYPPANGDLKVTLRPEAGGKSKTSSINNDGTRVIKGLKAGHWKVEVHHPNLVTVVHQSRIRIFDQPQATLVPIMLLPELFQDASIADLPDANLAPVQETAQEVQELLEPIGAKSGGELIKASDWNTLVGTVQSLAIAVGDLTQLVAPQGHNHPEIEEKLASILAELRTFSDAYGKSLIELQRQIEIASLEKEADKVLDKGGASKPTKDRVIAEIAKLKWLQHAPSIHYMTQLEKVGLVLQEAVNDMVSGLDDPEPFLEEEATQNVQQKAVAYIEGAGMKDTKAELLIYKQTGAQQVGGSTFHWATGK